MCRVISLKYINLNGKYIKSRDEVKNSNLTACQTIWPVSSLVKTNFFNTWPISTSVIFSESCCHGLFKSVKTFYVARLSTEKNATKKSTISVTYLVLTGESAWNALRLGQKPGRAREKFWKYLAPVRYINKSTQWKENWSANLFLTRIWNKFSKGV